MMKKHIISLSGDRKKLKNTDIILAKKKYDGIVHIKSFGCTPEINAMPILETISNEYEIPIIYFSFDSNNSEVWIDTRLEAFYDMLKAKKK